MLKARLAKLRNEILATNSSSGGGGEGFDVARCGDARVALIGWPSVGKSSLLSELTATESEAANYEVSSGNSSSICCELMLFCWLTISV